MKLKLDTETVLHLAGRVAFFCLTWVIILFALFLIGNYQQFLDANQRLIMILLSVMIVLSLGTGLLYLFLLIFLRDRSYHPGRGRIIILCVALVLSFLLFIILSFFQAWLLA